MNKMKLELGLLCSIKLLGSWRMHIHGQDQIKLLKHQKKDNIYPTAIEALNDDGRASHSTVDSSLASQSHQSNGWGFDFNLKSSSMGQNGLSSESYFETENNYDVNIKSKLPL